MRERRSYLLKGEVEALFSTSSISEDASHGLWILLSWKLWDNHSTEKFLDMMFPPKHDSMS